MQIHIFLHNMWKDFYQQDISLPVNDASNLLAGKLCKYGSNIAFIQCHKFSNFLLH